MKFPIIERDFLSLFGTQENMKKDALVSVNLANGKAYDQPGRIFMTDNTVQTTTDTLNAVSYTHLSSVCFPYPTPPYSNATFNPVNSPYSAKDSATWSASSLVGSSTSI